MTTKPFLLTAQYAPVVRWFEDAEGRMTRRRRLRLWNLRTLDRLGGITNRRAAIYR